MFPNDFLPVSTVRGYFYAYCGDGLTEEMKCVLVKAARLTEGRVALPRVGIQELERRL